jgi:RNA polymerase sigma-70 factor (ECF subfamily)
VEVLERDLVLAAKKGDRAAFKVLVERYYGRIHRMLTVMTRNQDVALDLTQETFAKAIEALPNFNMTSSFYTWIYRIARNLALDRFRRYKTAGGQSEYDDSREAQVAWGLGQTVPLEPSRAVAAQQSLNIVAEALDELKPQFKEIIILREIEEMSYEEISQTLNLKMGTVMSRLFQARMALRELLEPRLGANAAKL